MAYDSMSKKMGSYKGSMGSPKGFNTVKYSDRGERKGEQGTSGAYGQGSGPRIVHKPGPSTA